MIPSWGTHGKVVVITPGTMIEGGHPVEDWETATEREEPGCWSSAEASLAGSPVVGDVRAGDRIAWFNIWTQIDERARLRFPDSDTEWVIVGKPARRHSPTGSVSNIRVLCRDWKAAQ